MTRYLHIFCRRSSKHDTFVRNQVATVIPPLTEAIIKARIDNNYSMGTSIIEPLANLADRKLAMSRSIVSPKDTFTVCRVLNPTNSTIYVKKNLPLGRIEKNWSAFIEAGSTKRTNFEMQRKGTQSE